MVCHRAQYLVLNSFQYILFHCEIIQKDKWEFELYADDDQLYLVFKPNPEDSESARERVETCISELREWMVINFLMLNDDKTVF